MRYEETARPITTVEELDAARAAGALIEYTCCAAGFEATPEGNDHYGMPMGDGGWVAPCHDPRPYLPMADDRQALRAFYPELEA